MLRRERPDQTRRRFLRGLALTGLAGLAGCGSIPGFGGATDTYDLTAPVEVKGAGGSAAQYLVADPQALRVLDTERVVVSDGKGGVSYVSGAQWTDRLPKLVQARLVQTLENTGRVRAVGRPGQGLAIDYQIVTDIRRFEYQPGLRRASVEMSVKLMNDRNGRIAAAQIFRADTEVAQDSAPAIMAALDLASDQVMAGITKWVLGRS